MIQRITTNRFFYHTLFWLIFVMSFTLLLGGKYGYLESLKDVTLQAISYAAIIYVNLLVLLPKYLLKRKYLQYAFWLFVALLIIVPIHSIIEYYNFYNVEELQGQVKFYKLGFLSLINVTFMLALTTGLKFGKEWFKQQQKSQELEKEKLQSELKFLKAQINPHFLFNTLNNLYSLTLQKSDKAPEMVLKLSEMMRYMLYDSNEKRVSLEKEIAYMKNYIELEGLRQSNKIKIDFQLDYIPNGQQIAPLLFIPFLENSFKHGVNNNIDNGEITVRLKEQEGEIEFEVKNTKPNKITSNNNDKGIGLKNVRKRLELLYPDKYDLQIEDQPKTYRAQLKLKIK